MKRLIAVLTVLTVAALGASAAQAQYNRDPLAFGYHNPGALEGAFSADLATGTLAFLVVASPRNCNDGSDATVCPNEVRAWFYDSACTRVDTVAIPLTENDVSVVAIHAVSTVTAGNVLVAKADPAVPDTVLVDYCGTTPDVPIVGTVFEVFVNQGVMRTQTMARVTACSGGGWQPYKITGVLPFLPPDDGVSFVNTLQFRCPVGSALVDSSDSLFGTEGTLGGDMLEAISQGDGHTAGEAYNPAATSVDGEDICYPCTGIFGISNFANLILARVYDSDENLLGTAAFECACLTELRASDILAAAATNSTYWEMRGVADKNNSGETGGGFTGQYSILIALPSVQTMMISDRYHYSWDLEQLLAP